MANKNPIVNPSPSIMDRILGRAQPDPDFDNRMNLAQAKMRQEMPNEMSHASIQPTGFIGGIKDALVKKVIGGVPVATTSPLGNITYNKELLSGMKQNELEDTLAHELTHIGQFQNQPMWRNFMPATNATQEGLPEYTKNTYRRQGYDPEYRGRAAEIEAYQLERERQDKRGEGNVDDIRLPPLNNKYGRKINVGPTESKVK